ncbi:hypothetical protein VPH35_081203 [Triticum aestivum]
MGAPHRLPHRALLGHRHRNSLRTLPLPRPLQPVLLLSALRPAYGRGGSHGERPRDRAAVLPRAPGGRGGAGPAAPVPPPSPRPRLPRARAHYRRPLHHGRHSPYPPRRRPRRPLLPDLLHRGPLHLRSGRHHQLLGPPPRQR